MSSRKSQLIKSIDQAISAMPRKTENYRKYRISILHSFVEDLSSIGMLVPTLSHLSEAALRKVVRKWKISGISDQSIKNKLAVIRKVSGSNKFPSNSALHLAGKTHSEKSNVDTSMSPVIIHNPFIRDICQLQYMFGLKKYEAIRHKPIINVDGYILIPRDSAHNKKERKVICETEQQMLFVRYLCEKYPFGFSSSLKEDRALSLQHAACLEKINLHHSDAFRDIYTAHRFRTLSSKGNKGRVILSILREELGLSENKYISETIKCLESS